MPVTSRTPLYVGLAALLTCCGASRQADGAGRHQAADQAGEILTMDTHNIVADPALWEALAATPVGGSVRLQDGDEAAAARLLGLGFLPSHDDPHRLVRMVDLGAVPALRPTAVAELPGIDAIAVVSIDRGGDTPPYLYDTLRSAFARLPEGIAINVLVGDAHTDYVAPARLAAELGAHAEQVAVIPAEPAQAAFLAAHVGVLGRAVWNHGRAMRAYHGSRALLFLEDDVAFAAGIVPTLNTWLAAPVPEVLSTYNWFCKNAPGAAADPLHTVALATSEAKALPWVFSRTQAMVYRAGVVPAMGQTLGSRLQEAPADFLVDYFMRAHGLSLGFAQPSMMQHMGANTTGLGGFHQSQCFADPYPAAP